MRVLTGLGAIVIAGVVIALVVAWINHRAARAKRSPEETTERRFREVTKGYDAVIDDVDKLLEADKHGRFFLTDDERIALRAHVERFNNVYGR